MLGLILRNVSHVKLKKDTSKYMNINNKFDTLALTKATACLILSASQICWYLHVC